ncbi:MAG TPA: hypothetical protein VI300_23435 [Solirubrobacter sp.]
MTGVGAEPVPPGRWWGNHVGETRWILDAARLKVDPVWRGRGGIPHGDGRAVVLVPGFGGGDHTLTALAIWLRRIGYRPAVCGFLLNADCSERALERVERQVAAVYDGSGRRVAVIGHSRGGHFARSVAARRPELVSHAISLGADLQAMFHCSAPTLAAVDATRWVLHRLGRARRPDCVTSRCDCTFTAGFFAPFPEDRVHMTSIYSKDDGVVRWQAQVVPYADCVEVTGSHVGLIFNRRSYRAIAHALAADELGSSITRSA